MCSQWDVLRLTGQAPHGGCRMDQRCHSERGLHTCNHWCLTNAVGRVAARMRQQVGCFLGHTCCCCSLLLLLLASCMFDGLRATIVAMCEKMDRMDAFSPCLATYHCHDMAGDDDMSTDRPPPNDSELGC